MPDICSSGTNNTLFCNYCNLRFTSPYEYQNNVNFCGGSPLLLQSHLCLTSAIVVVVGGPLWLWSHLSQLGSLWWGSTLAPTLVPSLSHLSSLWWGVHSSSNSSSICLTWAHSGGRSTPDPDGVNHFFVYRQLSAVPDWIGSLLLDGQWCKKGVSQSKKCI